MPRVDETTGLTFSTLDEIMASNVGDTIHGWGGSEIEIAENENGQVTASDDGDTVDRNQWCNRTLDGDDVYYEVFTADGRVSHGWACDYCRRPTQTG